MNARCLIGSALVIALCIAAHAQDAPKPAGAEPKVDLPPASDILDGYILATGGKAAWQRIHSRSTVGTFEMAALGVKGKLETWAASPNKLATRVTMGELGSKETGCDGTNAWEVNKLGDVGELLGGNGAKLLEGDEQLYMLREATFNADLRWREVTKSAETIGEESVGGKDAYKVRVVTSDGAEMVMLYDKSTRLLVRVDTKARTALGEIDVQVFPSDYRKVDGVVVPFKTVSKMLGGEQTAVLERVEFNKNIDASKFVLPAELKKKAQAPAKPASSKPQGGKPKKGP